MKFEPICCSECDDSARDVSEAFLAGRESRVCFCAVTDQLDELARAEQAWRYAEQDWADEVADRRCDNAMDR